MYNYLYYWDLGKQKYYNILWYGVKLLKGGAILNNTERKAVKKAENIKGH